MGSLASWRRDFHHAFRGANGSSRNGAQERDPGGFWFFSIVARAADGYALYRIDRDPVFIAGQALG